MDGWSVGQSSQWVSGHWSVRLVKYVVDPSRLRARVLSALFLRICSKYVRFPSSDWNAKPFTWLIQTGSYVHDRFSSFSLINIQYATRLRLVTYFLQPALEHIKNTYCMGKRPFPYLYMSCHRRPLEIFHICIIALNSDYAAFITSVYQQQQ